MLLQPTREIMTRMRIRTGILATLCIPFIGLAQDSRPGMQPRVLDGDTSHCRAVLVRGGHLSTEQVCTRARIGEVTWDGHVAVVSYSDEWASTQWMRTHSLLQHLTVHHHDLYWDNKKVDLGKVDVDKVYEAFPWEGGVMIYGRTVPRRGFWESWPFKGHFIEVRDLDPFCVIYFNPKTLKGEDLWLNGRAYLGFLIFPLPN
jgi:hypothetical protein